MRPATSLHLVLRIVFLVALTTLLAIFIHRTHGYVSAARIATDDDSIANVAVSLWKGEGYGFPASPTLIHYGDPDSPVLKAPHFDGTHHYYNYGPAYFVVAGFLNWLIGDDTVAFFRMMTPWGLALIIGLGAWFFGRASYLPASLLGLGITLRFLADHGPVMARPDIAVSVGAVLFFIAAHFAIRRPSALGWAAAGFCASVAATSHLVAWSLVPAAALTWACFAAAHRREAPLLRRSFLGLLVGGVAGGLTYLIAMGFRLEALLSFLKIYGVAPRKPFFPNLAAQFSAAWSGSSWAYELGLAGLLAAALLLIASTRMPRERRTQTLAWVAPPLIAALLYTLSLGTYGAIHPAYGLLACVATLWTMAAAAAALLIWVPLPGRLVNLGAVVALALGTAFIARSSPPLERLAPGWVKHADYERQILDSLPPRAYVWGTLHLGVSSGQRTELVGSSAALSLALNVRPEDWARVAPDYLVLGHYELEQSLRSGPLRGRDSPLALLAARLPTHLGYQLSRIVHAPPYGSTFIYRKVTAGSRAAPITFALNDGASPQWHVSVGPESRPVARSVPPVTIDTSAWGGPVANARESYRLELPAGFHLIRARVPRTDPAQTGAIVASPGPYLLVNEDARIAHAPLLRGQTETSLVVDHLGGPLYVSYFPGRAGSKLPARGALEVLGVSAVLGSAGASRPLPDFSDWTATPGALKSPPIPVEPHRTYVLRIPTAPLSGGVGIRVLGPRGKSLIFDEYRTQPAAVVFSTGRAEAVTIEILGLAPRTGGPARFERSPGTLTAAIPTTRRVSELLACATTGRWIDGSTEPCAPVDDAELRRNADDLETVK